MIRARALRAREKLLSKLPVTGESLYGSVFFAPAGTKICTVSYE
jgi:hypothetical protein